MEAVELSRQEMMSTGLKLWGREDMVDFGDLDISGEMQGFWNHSAAFLPSHSSSNHLPSLICLPSSYDLILLVSVVEDTPLLPRGHISVSHSISS